MSQAVGSLSFQGLKVYYRAVEPECALKHRVMLLSSPLTSTFSWRKLVPELTELGCLMVMVDLPGFGRSDYDRSLRADPDIRANFVWGVLDEIDRETGSPLSTWHLMGQGLGCAVIKAMHDQYPDSVRSQLHLSPVFSPPPRLLGADPEKWFADNLYDRAGFRRFIERLSRYPMDEYVLDRMHEPMTRPDAMRAMLEILRPQPTRISQPGDFCPSMTIWGGLDPLMAECDAAARRALPDTERHVLKTAGHFITETHSKALRDYIRGWLRYLE